MTLTFDLSMTLTLDFQDQIFQLLYLRKGLSAWHDMMLAAQYDFDLGFLRTDIEVAVFQEWMGPALFGTFAQM